MWGILVENIADAEFGAGRRKNLLLHTPAGSAQLLGIGIML